MYEVSARTKCLPFFHLHHLPSNAFTVWPFNWNANLMRFHLMWKKPKSNLNLNFNLLWQLSQHIVDFSISIIRNLWGWCRQLSKTDFYSIWLWHLCTYRCCCCCHCCCCGCCIQSNSTGSRVVINTQLDNYASNANAHRV